MNWVQSDAGEDVGMASIDLCLYLVLAWGVTLALLICLAASLPRAKAYLVFLPRNALMVYASR